jgi:ABC-type transporter Mla maintaining outer membrane lipid asymmetry ATPase subunit MlaF
MQPAVELIQVTKAYGGLRPLRVRALALHPGEQVALAGFDQTTAEVFVNLVTGATLPEEGEVRVFGRPTSAITDSDDWLNTVDRFGIVSQRVVLLEQLTAAQNIALSLTLDLDDVPPHVAATVEALCAEVGLAPATRQAPVAEAGVAVRHRIRLARALAGEPAVLLVEHPTAGLTPEDVASLGADLQRAASDRQIAVMVLVADPSAAQPFAPQILTLNGATGELTTVKKRGFLGRVFGTR